MPHRGKRYREGAQAIDRTAAYGLEEAVAALRAVTGPKFDETVELAMSLGIDPKQSEQQVRGTLSLPHGTGRRVRVAVFAQGSAADAAREAGADFVGLEDLVAKVQEGWTDFDAAIATTEAMQQVRRLGRVLGPRGLMPTPKAGTVTDDVGPAVREIKAGRVEFKADKTANVHIACGKRSFPAEHIVANLKAAIDAVVRAKPAASRGQYVRSCTVSTTMGPGVRLDARELTKA